VGVKVPIWGGIWPVLITGVWEFSREKQARILRGGVEVPAIEAFHRCSEFLLESSGYALEGIFPWRYFDAVVNWNVPRVQR